ncbi:hypothetical protein F0344_12685 [Streptomyces finlayi]|uniref:DUF3040 domain-containing protein n=1 Tax=Streptomyces finlayi TaxID=67296 RepID=A0A7G7BJ46_9ACTN|nr:hypothetical protein [Streptomyces finlayi]QNE75361.1 hypothetical protein F0344_12685 [Streptomyces finlayi]
MSRRDRADRKVDEVRRMLEGPRPQVPADLALRAAERGTRLLRRHRAARLVVRCLMCAAVVAFVVWAGITRPWELPPSGTTPPLEGW